MIANLYSMYSFLNKEIENGYKKETLLNNYKKILTVINPIIPHFSNECLEIIGFKNEIKWPTYDHKFIEENYVPMVIQINGKKRALINMKKDIGEEELLKIIKKENKINKYIDGKKIKKQIFIK